MGWIFLGIGVLFLVVVIIAYVLSYTKKPKSQQSRIEDLYGDKYTTDMNRFAAGKERKASLARSDLLSQLNIEADSLHHKELAEANVLLTRLAAQEGLDTQTYLEVRKQAEINRLDLEKEWKQAYQAIKGGFIYQMQAQQHLLLLTEYINGLYEQARQFAAVGKERERALVEEHIDIMEKDFRARAGLLQTNNRQITEGSNADSKPSGNA